MRNKRGPAKLIIATVLGSAMLYGFAVHAEEFIAPGFKILDPVITISGGLSQSQTTGFQLQGSVGQLAPGLSSIGTFGLKAGFLFFPAPGVPGVSPVPPPAPAPIAAQATRFVPLICFIADFNCDGKINIADLSIFLYWFNKPIALAARYDLNLDALLDIRDISIMLYYWTG